MASLLKCRRRGRWLRCQDEWWLYLVPVRGVCFGWCYDRVRRELVLILGCRIREFAAPGIPRSFSGGLHPVLGLGRWFSYDRR